MKYYGTDQKKPRILVAQLGARMHYAVPRILESAQALGCLYTDFLLPHAVHSVLSCIPNAFRPHTLQRILGRAPKGVSRDRIRGLNQIGRKYFRLRRQSGNKEKAFAAHLWAGKAFCERIVDCGLQEHYTHVYTYNSAGLELILAARQQGIQALHEQTIAPLAYESKLLSEERERFGGWEQPNAKGKYHELYMEREAKEWQVAHTILCGSAFVRNGISICGGPVDKCVIVPYGVDPPIVMQQPPKFPQDSVKAPLRVLTVGSIGLRKGSPYVLEVAKQLKGLAEFRMVGGIEVLNGPEAQLRRHIELTGAVPRSLIRKHFEWADVFLLPSICEGSATVTYEALSYGLPVICTPNTGSVVRHGLDGFIVPPRQIEAIIEHLIFLAKRRGTLVEMSQHARTHAQDYTIEAYGSRLLTVLGFLNERHG